MTRNGLVAALVAKRYGPPPRTEASGPAAPEAPIEVAERALARVRDRWLLAAIRRQQESQGAA